MSSNRLIWLTETPNRAGTINFKIRRTPGSLVSQIGRGTSSSRYSDGNWNSNWINPAKNTPQASAKTGSSNQGAATVAAKIRDKLRNTGVNAGTAKRPKLFRMAPQKPVMDISSR